MLLTNGLLTNDVLRWKAIGAAVWAAAVAIAAFAVWSLSIAPATLLSPPRLLGAVFSPSAWLAALALVLAQGPAFVAQAAALTTREPRPLNAHRLLHWPRLAAGAAALGRLAARASSVAGAARLAAFFALHVLSAILCLSIYPTGLGAPSQGGHAGCCCCWLGSW